MHFRTEINIQPETNLIDYQSKILLLGSCFTDNIGEKFRYFKLDVLSNPFGVIFNPISIEKLISRSLNDALFTEKDFINYNEKWQSLDLHSLLSNSDLQKAISNANKALLYTKEYLSKATHIFITLGTSWVYRQTKNHQIVANCHKLPQKLFDKEILAVSSIQKALQSIIDSVKKINPKASIIFTVSPVRHLKDGFIENNQSKAHLLTAVHLTNKQNDISYFPAYEMMLDDLRDYRFYAKDMLHPNETAIDYIWDKFKNTWLDKNTYPILKKIDSIQKRLQHKPFNEQSEKHQIFIKKLQEDIRFLKRRYAINF